jgi:hypothetical protein
MQYKRGIKARIFIYSLFYIFLFNRATHAQDKPYPNEFPLVSPQCMEDCSTLMIIDMNDERSATQRKNHSSNAVWYQIN